MKKRILALLLCMITTVSLVGCGNKEGSAEGTESVEDTESTEMAALPEVDLNQYDYQASELVTLGDYSAVPLTLTGDYEVEDQDVTDYFTQLFTNYGPFFTDDASKTTIEEGDIVKVDYVGKLDGEAFSGGSAEDQLLDVSNNSSPDGTTYIDGFTAGLMGHSVGEVVDCDVTFPEEYGNSDLAGQAVVFTFTVKAIEKELSVEEVDDTFAQEQFGVDTTDEMYAQIRTYLEASAESAKEEDTYTALQEYLMETSTVDVPEDFVNAKVMAYENYVVTNYYGGDFSGFESDVNTYYGYTVEEMEAVWAESFTKDLQIELILSAIAEAEGIAFDQEGYDEYIANVVSANGMESSEALYKECGFGDTVYGENHMKKIYVANLAREQVKDSAVITVEAVEETVSTETEEVQDTEAE